MNHSLVKLKQTATAGVGVFVNTATIGKNTILGEFGGKVIRVKDNDGNRLRPDPVGDTIIRLEYERGIFLDSSSTPDFGEDGCY